MTKDDLCALVSRARAYECVRLPGEPDRDYYHLSFCVVRDAPVPERELKFEPSGTE